MGSLALEGPSSRPVLGEMTTFGPLPVALGTSWAPGPGILLEGLEESSRRGVHEKLGPPLPMNDCCAYAPGPGCRIFLGSSRVAAPKLKRGQRLYLASGSMEQS
mmetsp:Transcript_142495/g.454709  ORF Transcript_142495/g.454709 Transcript_142495/m.454709 type:complete len:104 (+) Transcript_142495:346-657(+)